jgi:hypothetical protein
MSKIFATLLLLESCSAWRAVPTLDRRAAVLGGSALLWAAPSPGWAKSKEKAKEKAIQKETAREAAQAMKEYKSVFDRAACAVALPNPHTHAHPHFHTLTRYAPRPELVGNAESGYTFKEGTVKAGSQGELAGYFTNKGEVLRAEYKAEKARATGATALEADKVKATTVAKAGPRGELSTDEKQINAKLDEFRGQRDEQGRVIGGLQASKNKQSAADVEFDEETLEMIESLKFKGRKY